MSMNGVNAVANLRLLLQGDIGLCLGKGCTPSGIEGYVQGKAGSYDETLTCW